ncbi:MAG: DUF3604 domain-containing protein [Thiohalocapsa sp.]
MDAGIVARAIADASGPDFFRVTGVAGAKAPHFRVCALRDPNGANLDRIQIVKGWLGADGEVQERSYDIVVSDGREIGADGRIRTPESRTQVRAPGAEA